MAVGPSTANLSTEIARDKKPTQPEIFSDKPKPNRCIEKIHVQQRSMVEELKKIKSLLKKKKN